MKKGLLAIALLTGISFAADYALVVGVGEYQSPEISSLSSVDEDIANYQSILNRFSVNEKHVCVLKNQEATKEKIINELSSISNKINDGDRFFMFFSGHGVSLFDDDYSSKLQEVGLKEVMKGSGAILPYDFEGSKEHISDTLIIGSRDLRPLLEQIDKKVKKNSLIIFDACFSKDAIKDINGTKTINRTPNILTEDQDYPYQNITYIASSIIQSSPGKFSPILKTCLTQHSDMGEVKKCINKEVGDTMQIPAILSGDN